MRKVVCPYCGNDCKITTGDKLFGMPDLKDKILYQCAPCDAHIGCHKGTDIPFGIPARKHLRSLRTVVHDKFDKLWTDKKLARILAYRWMAQELGVSQDQAHIGLMDQNQCDKILRALKSFGDTDLV